ncbi:MAG: lysophospholipase [Gemmatimonadota bacterium]|nr:lysophospholipase [Gemmatimonadota bacterium]
MRYGWLAAPLALVLQPTAVFAQERVSFFAHDSVEITAHLYESDEERPTPVVLAFHQAGYNGRGEYGPIAERLNREGFTVLAVDMRSGGEAFGYDNVTVSGRGESTEYCAAEGDIGAAIEFVEQRFPRRRFVLWGSSFSGALVLRVASHRPDGLAGVLVFSPASGGPMVECSGDQVSSSIEAPVQVFRPVVEMEVESVAVQAELFKQLGHSFYVADPARHGSSMLVEDRVAGDVTSTWKVVLGFLDRVSR